MEREYVTAIVDRIKMRLTENEQFLLESISNSIIRQIPVFVVFDVIEMRSVNFNDFGPIIFT